jgi:hypothetical protein
VIGGIDTNRGPVQALIALCFAIVSAVGAIGLWRAVRGKMTRMRVVSMAEAASPSGDPDGEILVKVGQEMGHYGVVTDGRLETAEDYARRVFGVEKIAATDAKTLLLMMHSGNPSVGPH